MPAPEAPPPLTSKGLSDPGTKGPQGDDSGKDKSIESSLATPKPRWTCAQAALREALALCATPDGKPDLAGLTAAEDRYNAALAEDMIASVLSYAERISAPDGEGARETRVAIGPEFAEFFKVPCEVGAIQRARLGPHDGPIAAIVCHARNPCAVLGPFSTRGYYPLTLAGPEHTGRPRHVETAMWRTWWMSCVETLTSASGTDGPVGSVRPLDAPFCASALALARALLDMGAERAGAHLEAEASRKGSVFIGVNLDGSSRLVRPQWGSVEDGLSDHVARHWVHMPYDRDTNPNAPPDMVKWRMARATLVGFIGVMERIYNTHAIYDALGVAKFESDVVARSVPSHLFS